MPSPMITLARTAVRIDVTKMPLPSVVEYGHQSAWKALVPVNPRIVSVGWMTSTARMLA